MSINFALARPMHCCYDNTHFQLCPTVSSIFFSTLFLLLSLMALDNERNESPIGTEQDQPFEEIVVPVETPHKQEL